MGSNSNATKKASKGGKWKGWVHFHIDNGQWEILQTPDEITAYFRDKLQADKEIIIFTEIRKYALGCIPMWFGNWHEYTLIKTTNWHWSFEKHSAGIFVQRSKDRDDVRCNFGGQRRDKKDEEEGRSSKVAFEENILDAVTWIFRRDELSNTYHFYERNCHVFASLLYEAITRKKNRALSNDL